MSFNYDPLGGPFGMGPVQGDIFVGGNPWSNPFGVGDPYSGMLMGSVPYGGWNGFNVGGFGGDFGPFLDMASQAFRPMIENAAYGAGYIPDNFFGPRTDVLNWSRGMNRRNFLGSMGANAFTNSAAATTLRNWSMFATRGDPSLSYADRVAKADAFVNEYNGPGVNSFLNMADMMMGGRITGGNKFDLVSALYDSSTKMTGDSMYSPSQIQGMADTLTNAVDQEGGLYTQGLTFRAMGQNIRELDRRGLLRHNITVNADDISSVYRKGGADFDKAYNSRSIDAILRSADNETLDKYSLVSRNEGESDNLFRSRQQDSLRSRLGAGDTELRDQLLGGLNIDMSALSKDVAGDVLGNGKLKELTQRAHKAIRLLADLTGSSDTSSSDITRLWTAIEQMTGGQGMNNQVDLEKILRDLQAVKSNAGMSIGAMTAIIKGASDMANARGMGGALAATGVSVGLGTVAAMRENGFTINANTEQQGAFSFGDAATDIKIAGPAAMLINLRKYYGDKLSAADRSELELNYKRLTSNNLSQGDAASLMSYFSKMKKLANSVDPTLASVLNNPNEAASVIGGLASDEQTGYTENAKLFQVTEDYNSMYGAAFRKNNAQFTDAQINKFINLAINKYGGNKEGLEKAARDAGITDINQIRQLIAPVIAAGAGAGKNMNAGDYFNLPFDQMRIGAINTMAGRVVSKAMHDAGIGLNDQTIAGIADRFLTAKDDSLTGSALYALGFTDTKQALGAIGVSVTALEEEMKSATDPEYKKQLQNKINQLKKVSTDLEKAGADAVRAPVPGPHGNQNVDSTDPNSVENYKAPEGVDKIVSMLEGGNKGILADIRDEIKAIADIFTHKSNLS